MQNRISRTCEAEPPRETGDDLMQVKAEACWKLMFHVGGNLIYSSTKTAVNGGARLSSIRA